MTDLDLIKLDEYDKIAEVDAIEAVHPTLGHLRSIEATVATDAFTPIKQDCSRQYFAAHHSGTRPTSAIWWIVMHSTEGSTARAAATWFQNPESQGSTHTVVDDNICFRTLPEDYIPWGARGANYHGYHIEQAGFAKWATTMWSATHRNTLRRAAFRAAVRCKRFNIPVRFCDAAMLRANKKGITTHNECTKAFGGSHWDPGPGYPMKLFLYLTNYYLKRLP